MKLFSSKNPKKNDQPAIKVYLAGPDVFKQNALQIGEDKSRALAEVGFVGVFPLDNKIEDFRHDVETAHKISKLNEELMDDANIILVNMTPFHGPSMDVGTAFEAGYMSCKAKLQPEKILIVGYYEGKVELDYTERCQQQSKIDPLSQ